MKKSLFKTEILISTGKESYLDCFYKYLDIRETLD